jgi:hypothetical protein
MNRVDVLSNWSATFTDLRLAGVSLSEWLAYWAADRQRP